MTRLEIRNAVRAKTRQENLKPIEDDFINDTIESAINDMSVRMPFCVAVDRIHSVADQREYITATDIIEVIEVFYKDAAGVLLNTTMNDSVTTVVAASAITEFPTSGSIQIENEVISYTGKSGNTFTGCTRGTNATAHTAGVGIVEYGNKLTRLKGTTPRILGDEDETYIENDSGVPESYYLYPGIIGFDKAPDTNGYRNIVMRMMIRPPQLSSDTMSIASLLQMFYDAVINFCSSEVCNILAQDEATLASANKFWQKYMANMSLFKTTEHLYSRQQAGQLVPTGR